MRRLLLTSAAVLAFAGAANAQWKAVVVASCGTPPGGAYVEGQSRPLLMDTNGLVCTDAAGGGGDGGAPTDAPYYVTTANGDLSAEVVVPATGVTFLAQTSTSTMLTTGLGLSANGRALVQAADYAAMRALLDLEAGTDFYSITAADAAFQPLDSDLTSIAALTTTSFGRGVLDDANAAALQTTAGTVIGTNVQAYDADLTTYAGITPSANVQTLLGTASYAAFIAQLDGDLTTWAGTTPGTGVATALATPTTANFNTMLSDNDFATLAGSESLTNKTIVSFELGSAATDTTITRAGAGSIAAEGVAIPTISSTSTLTNKTVALGSNTVSGTTAQFNTANTDGDFVTLAGSETLTNKTITAPSITSPGITGGNHTQIANASGLTIYDTDSTHTLAIIPGSNLTANRIFTLTTGDAARTLTMTSDVSIGAGQYQGVATNTDAAAGNIGEFVSSTVASGSAVSLVSSTAKTVTSVSLTAGDWNCWGTVGFTGGATTNITSMWGGVGSTTNTLPPESDYTVLAYGTGGQVPFANTNPQLTVPTVRKLLSSTTTIYLIADAFFTVSTATAYGKIECRRTH